MRAEQIEVWRLLGTGYQYIIPIYQRRYNWGTKQCSRLYDDILKIGSGDKSKSHFIGAMTCIDDITPAYEDTRTYQIIDGQQRFTTLMLLLTALKNLLNNNNDAKNVTVQKIEQLLFNITATSKSNDYYKLVLTDSDDKSFKQILDDEESEESNNIVANFKFFKNILTKTQIDPDIIWRGIRRLTIVNINIEKNSGDDPQEIFESMNSTGLDLSNTDLIRNYILMRYDANKQERIYKNFWEKMENQVGEDGNLDEFLRNYLMMKKGIFISKKTIYEYFKDYARDLDMTELISDMLDCSKQYTKLVHGNHEMKKLDKVINHILDQKTTIAHPLLLKILVDFYNKKITLEQAIQIFLLIDCYLLRCTICNTGLQAANRMFSESIHHIKYNEYVKSIEQFLMAKTAANLRFPRNDLFKEKLLESELYSNQTICKYILARIEQDGSKEIMDTENLEIEHIMPQTLNNVWKNDLGKTWEYVHEKFLHNIGNLTLTAYNAEISNSSFDNKKSFYSKSRLKITRNICDYQKWNDENIIQRGKILTTKAVQIWKIPEEYHANTDDDDMTEKEYLDGKEVKELWHKLKNRILSACPDTKFEMMKKYGAIKYYNQTNKDVGICGMTAYVNKIHLTYNCKIKDRVLKSTEFIENISEIGHYYHGDFRSIIISDDDIDKAIPYVIKIYKTKVK